jgi:hypothetical protein
VNVTSDEAQATRLTANSPQPMKRPFRALDPRLPALAATAAVQLDNLLLRQKGVTTAPAELDAVEDLARLLKAALVSGQSGDVRALMDPITTSVFTSAYKESHQGAQLQSLEDLSTVASQLLSEFLSVESAQQSEKLLSSMRDFCIALSNFAASKQESVYGGRQQHPHKK